VSEREFDVVVFGATGVTGRRVAAYLAERSAEVGATWAAAARDPAKLERMLGSDGVDPPATIAADVSDPHSLLAMAQRAKVVLDLVGPYTLHGRPVIEACVASGAHYADLTGEIPFVRRIIDEFHEAAVEQEVKIVQVCGFEALPADLAVRAAAERANDALAEVDLAVAVTGRPAGMPRPSDGLSGGTLQSVAAIAGDEDAAVITDPGALITDPDAAARARRASPIDVAPRRGRRGEVIAPMSPAAFINPAVIQRSAQLADPEAPPFAYREGIAIPGGAPSLPLRYAAAGALSATQAGIARLVRAKPATRQRISATLARVLPSSGFGPQGDRLEDWRWRMDVSARTVKGDEVAVRVDADGHPGYLATARMLGEAGLVLADDEVAPPGAGCLTPALALGTGSLPRFRAARLRFDVGDRATERV
jgi:short subunit dehydrogenase-like uncharacterized protein